MDGESAPKRHRGEHPFTTFWSQKFQFKERESRDEAFRSIGRRPDVVLYHDWVMEIQHSRMNGSDNAALRNGDYEKAKKKVFWHLDGDVFGCEVKSRPAFGGAGPVLLRFKCQISSMVCCKLRDMVAVHVYSKSGNQASDDDFERGEVYLVRPDLVKKQMVWTMPLSVAKFVDLFRDDERGRRLLEESAPPKQFSLVVNQQPPGSGKTYKYIDACLHGKDFCGLSLARHEIFIVLTKPHSAKEVAIKEFEEQLKKGAENGLLESIDKIGDDERRNLKCLWQRVRRLSGTEVLFIFATADSLLWNLKHESRGDEQLDLFRDICRTIELRGPRVLSKAGAVCFKQIRFEMNANTLLCVDEATKLPEYYLPALASLMQECSADAILSGDVLQSIEFEQNLFRKVFETSEDELRRELFPDCRIIKEKGNKIRRFGPELVEVNRVLTPWTKYHLEPPIETPFEELIDGRIVRTREFEKSEIFVHVMENISEEEKFELELNGILGHLRSDVRKLHLLPKDVLFVMPAVSKNPLAEQLRLEVDRLWRELLTDETFLRLFDAEKLSYVEKICKADDKRWFAHLHRSENGRPVDTSLSVDATRMVSIHAAQGDGRIVCYTVGLSEAALWPFSQNSDSLVSDALLNVSISRSKHLLRVFVENRDDAIWRKLQRFTDAATMRRVTPTFHIPCQLRVPPRPEDAWLGADKLRMESRRIVVKALDASWGPDWRLMSSGRKLIETEHHSLRAIISRFVTTISMSIDEREGRDKKMRQVCCVLHKINNAEVYQEADLREYRRLLQKLGRRRDSDDKESLRLPLLRLEAKLTVFNEIFEATKRVKETLKRALSGQTNLREMLKLTARECVMLQHLVDLREQGIYAPANINLVYDIFSSDVLGDHYEYVKDALEKFAAMKEKLVGECVEWKIFHEVGIGPITTVDDHDADDRRYRLDGFALWDRQDFIAVGDSKVVSILIVPRVDEMSLEALTHRALMTTAQILQPAGKNNIKRFGGKKVCVCVIPAESGDILWIDDLDNVVKLCKKELADYLASYVRRLCDREHDQVVLLAEHHKKDIHKAWLHAQEKLKAHIYVLQSLRAYRKSRDQTRETLVNILTEELETTIEDMRKSFMGDSVAIDALNDGSSLDPEI